MELASGATKECTRIWEPLGRGFGAESQKTQGTCMYTRSYGVPHSDHSTPTWAGVWGDSSRWYTTSLSLSLFLFLSFSLFLFLSLSHSLSFSFSLSFSLSLALSLFISWRRGMRAGRIVGITQKSGWHLWAWQGVRELSLHTSHTALHLGTFQWFSPHCLPKCLQHSSPGVSLLPWSSCCLGGHGFHHGLAPAWPRAIGHHLSCIFSCNEGAMAGQPLKAHSYYRWRALCSTKW